MSLKKIYLFIGLFILSLSSFAQAGERLMFIPNRPVAGQSVSLSYQPLKVMENAKWVKAYIYSFNHFQWNTYEITLSKENSLWKGTFNIPQNSGLIIAKIVTDSVIDNNDEKSFACMISDSSKSFMPGAYAGWGLFRSANYGYDIPNYINLDKHAVSDTVVYFWLRREVENRRESNVPMSFAYVKSLKNAKIQDATSKEAKVMNFLLSNGSEDALINAMRIAQYNGRKAQSDSISEIIVKKYPQGKWAFKKTFDAIAMVRDMNVTKDKMLEMLQNFPINDELESFIKNYGRHYDDLYQTILYIDAVNKRFDGIEKYIPRMSFGGSVNIFYRLVEVPHLRKDTPDSTLLKYADIIVNHMEKIKNIKSVDYDYMSDEEWEKWADKSLAKNVYIYYVDMLKNVGNSQKALEYAYKAQKVLEYKSALLNEDMAALLSQFDKEPELQTLLEKSIYINQTSDKMMDMLKALYYKKHHSYEGYDKYVASFKNPGDKSTLVNTVKEYKQSGMMPAWKLVDASGKTVSSELLKGKVYVLDFWASWCVPCKASFPGMKMAVEHYKDDKDVKFYFVDTEEMIAGYQAKAVAYLKANNYPFNLLFDSKEKGSKVNDGLVKKITSKYSISGIPLKIIVDRNGAIQFIAIGYKGSPSGLSDEMIEMIEQAKNVK